MSFPQISHLPLIVLSLILTAPFSAFAQTPEQDAPDEIIVTGTRIPAKQDSIGNHVTVLDGETIELQGMDSIGDVLRQVPGLAVNRTGGFGGLTQIRLRGAEANQVLILLDGVEIAPAGQGEVDLSSLLTSDIERIEIIRGSQSGLYGSNALAGVINIISRRDAGSGLRANLEYGAFDTSYGQLAAYGGNDASYISGTYARRETSGYDASLLGNEKDGGETSNALLRAGHKFSENFTLDLWLRYGDKNADTDGFDFSGGPNQGLAFDDDSFTKSEDWNSAITAKFSLLQGRLDNKVIYSYSQSKQEGGAGALVTFGNDNERRKLTLQSTYFWQAGANNQHALTGFYEREEERFQNLYPFDPSQIPTLSRDLNGYGFEYRGNFSDRFYLNIAARKDENDAFKDAQTASINAAWIFPKSQTRLHASAGKAITNPTFFEQFGFVPGTFTGNPNLKPEQAETFDIGIEKTFAEGRAVADITLFKSDLRDEIRSVFPSIANDSGTSKRSGIETSLNANLSDNLRFTSAYIYLDASEADGSAEVQRPRHQANFNLFGQFANGRGNYTLGVNYQGERLDTDFRNFFTNGFSSEKTPLGAYTIARASASWQLNEHLQLFGRVENLFDTDYQETIGYGVPGQAAYIGLRVGL